MITGVMKAEEKFERYFINNAATILQVVAGKQSATLKKRLDKVKEQDGEDVNFITREFLK